jgi:hypothetical protein
MLSVVLLSVTNETVMLSVTMPCRYAECRYADCRYAECRNAGWKQLTVATTLAYYDTVLITVTKSFMLQAYGIIKQTI